MSSASLPVRAGGKAPAVKGRPPKREDRDFVEGVRAAGLQGPRTFAYGLLAVVLIFFAVALAWANWATLDEVTRGDGQVIPSRQVQVVQNFEGGIVSDILVREGEIVEEGQVLLRLENVNVSSGYGENRARYLGLLATIARLNAEITGAALTFPDEVLEEDPEAAANERTLYATRQTQLAAQIEILERQVEQRQNEVAELESRLGQTERSLDLAQEELQITNPLVERGIVSQVEGLRLRREVNDLEGQLEQTRQSLAGTRSALAEAERRIDEARDTFRAEALQERNAFRTELQALIEVLQGEGDRVSRTEVRAPLAGTIKDLKINTIGGVIQPGQDIVEIVPIEDTLLVEARVRPADIAFVRPGLPATVKITAYDFSVYGGLDGEVEDISADTITDERDPSQVYYRVRVRTDEGETFYDLRTGEELPIIPGMTAQIDVLTGEKTVLDYLLKPILKARDTAMTER